MGGDFSEVTEQTRHVVVEGLSLILYLFDIHHAV